MGWLILCIRSKMYEHTTFSLKADLEKQLRQNILLMDRVFGSVPEHLHFSGLSRAPRPDVQTPYAQVSGSPYHISDQGQKKTWVRWSKYEKNSGGRRGSTWKDKCLEIRMGTDWQTVVNNLGGWSWTWKEKDYKIGDKIACEGGSSIHMCTGVELLCEKSLHSMLIATREFPWSWE